MCVNICLPAAQCYGGANWKTKRSRLIVSLSSFPRLNLSRKVVIVLTSDLGCQGVSYHEGSERLSLALEHMIEFPDNGNVIHLIMVLCRSRQSELCRRVA